MPAMRARWAAVAMATAALVCTASLWLQREEPPPDLTGTWHLRPDPPRPAWAKPLQRPLGDELAISEGRIAWRGTGGEVSRPYTLERQGGTLVLTIDLDNDGAPDGFPLAWLQEPDGAASFGLGQLYWSGWWIRQPTDRKQ